MGPNNLQNFPVDLAVVGKTLTGESCPFCLVEVFVTDTPPDPSGHGEGMVFVGDVLADGSGDFSIT